MKRTTLAGILLLAASVFAMPANAVIIQYELGSHPDGNAAPPDYGLRLDGLYTLNTNDIWTFDFDHASSDMRMDLDTVAETVHIYGTSYGGLDLGAGYDANLQGVWSIDFMYSVNVTVVGAGAPNIDVVVDPEAPLSNNGTLTALFSATDGAITVTNGDVINLEQEMEFFFNNIDDHRLGGHGLSGPETHVGWGWLNHSDSAHIYASDWLFTATVVPVPAAVWLFGSALGLLGWLRRRPS